MLKKTITYLDYNDEERTDEFFFHFSRAELIMMDASRAGGMQNYYDRIVREKDQVAIMECFKDLIHRSIGYKSDDGKRFIKTEEFATAFEQTEAYSELIMELLGDSKAAADFFTNILPASLAKDIAKHGDMPVLVSD